MADRLPHKGWHVSHCIQYTTAVAPGQEDILLLPGSPLIVKTTGWYTINGSKQVPGTSPLLVRNRGVIGACDISISSLQVITPFNFALVCWWVIAPVNFLFIFWRWSHPSTFYSCVLAVIAPLTLYWYVGSDRTLQLCTSVCWRWSYPSTLY